MSQIKNRLKIAYENVEFYANTTWADNSDAYQRANQELFVRESKVEEPIRPRTVQDSIPQSKLAKYSNYEYDESRELCYASSATDISFYYPCTYKRNSIIEPWMIPETEQLFIWFSYAPDFNILEIIQLEELRGIEEEEKLRVHPDTSCCWKDMHEVYPVFYETFEKTPGKPRYTSCLPISETDLSVFTPSQFKIQTFEDIMLGMKIKSVVLTDKVKYLWSAHTEPRIKPVEKAKEEIDSTPQLNCLLQECRSPPKIYRNQKLVQNNCSIASINHIRQTDFAQLQRLADSIRASEPSEVELERKQDKISTNNHESPETLPILKTLSTKPLYSAVLQGLSNKKPLSCTDIAFSVNSYIKEQSSFSLPSTASPVKTTPSCFSPETASTTSLSRRHKSSPAVQNQTCTTTFAVKNDSLFDQELLPINDTPINLNSKSTTSQKNETLKRPYKLITASSSTAIATFYSDTCTNSINAVPNISWVPSHLTNIPCYSHNPLCYNNVYNNNTYINNSYHCNSQYQNFQHNVYQGSNYSNNLYSTNAYHSSQVSNQQSRNILPQCNRASYPPNQLHVSPSPSIWYFQHNRPIPTVYSVSHFTSQPYVILPHQQSQPSPQRQNQRWTTPVQYVRPPAQIQSYQTNMTPQNSLTSFQTQHWGMQNQNLYRANSNNQMLDNSSLQNCRTKFKPNKFNVNNNYPQPKINGRSTNSIYSGERLDNMEIYPGTYALSSAGQSKRSTGSSELSCNSQEKQSTVKPTVSTPTLDYKTVPLLTNSKTLNHTNIERGSLALTFHKEKGHFQYLPRDSEEPHTALPVTASFSEDLERQALEQYHYSNENFYQDLERQAEEQYDDDNSENWISPPNLSLFFGGLVVYSKFMIFRISNSYCMCEAFYLFFKLGIMVCLIHS